MDGSMVKAKFECPPSDMPFRRAAADCYCALAAVCSLAWPPPDMVPCLGLNGHPIAQVETAYNIYQIEAPVEIYNFRWVSAFFDGSI